MSNVSKYFNKENNHKVFYCVVNGEEALLQCYYNIDHDCVEAYFWTDPRDLENYIDDIQEVLCEQTFEDDFDYSGKENLLSKEDQDTLKSAMIQEAVYSYSSKEELDKLLTLLRVDIIDGNQDSNKGLFFYYYEYDDYSCYGDGYTYYVKIIDNAEIRK